MTHYPGWLLFIHYLVNFSTFSAFSPSLSIQRKIVVVFEGFALSQLQYVSTFHSLSEQRGNFDCVQRVCSVTISVLLVLSLEKLAKAFSKRVIYF